MVIDRPMRKSKQLNRIQQSRLDSFASIHHTTGQSTLLAMNVDKIPTDEKEMIPKEVMVRYMGR